MAEAAEVSVQNPQSQLERVLRDPQLNTLFKNAGGLAVKDKSAEKKTDIDLLKRIIDDPDFDILFRNASLLPTKDKLMKKSGRAGFAKKVVLAGTLATVLGGGGVYAAREPILEGGRRIETPEVIYDPNKIFAAENPSPNPTPTETSSPTLTPTPEPTINPKVLAEKEVGNRNIAEFFVGNLVDQFKQKRMEKFKNDPEFAKRIQKEFLDSNQINVLYLGTDEDRSETGYNGEGLGRTDSIILLSFDPHTFKTTAISIPRDLYDPIVARYIPSVPKINGMNMIRGKDIDPNEFEKLIIENVTGVPIDMLIKTNVDFMQGGGTDSILDQIFPGGLEIDVPKTLVQDGTVLFEAGKQIMHGAKATSWARVRYPDSDFARAERQRQLVQIIMKNLLSNIMADLVKGDTQTLDTMINALEKEKNAKNLFYDKDVIEIIRTMRNGLTKLRSTPQGIAVLAILGANTKDVAQSFLSNGLVSYGLDHEHGIATVAPGEGFDELSILKVDGSKLQNSNPLLYYDPIRKRVFEVLHK